MIHHDPKSKRICSAQTQECPLLQVLVRLLTKSPTDRMTEVALGILANLATHPGCAARILAEEGLVAVALDRFLTSIHAPTLTEVRPCARSPYNSLAGGPLCSFGLCFAAPAVAPMRIPFTVSDGVSHAAWARAEGIPPRRE